MGRNRSLVATLSPCRHHIPAPGAEDALGSSAVLSDPAQGDNVLAEMCAIEFHDTQPTTFRGVVHMCPHHARGKPPTRGRLVTVTGPRPSGRLDEVPARCQQEQYIKILHV